MKRGPHGRSLGLTLVGRGRGPAVIGFDDPGLVGLLGLPPAHHDPVTIITAAQLRLRRWRRLITTGAGRPSTPRSAAAQVRIRRISAARDALLRQGVVPDGRVDGGRMAGPRAT